MNQDTILKANYNRKADMLDVYRMYFNEPRYNFESELQQIATNSFREIKMYFNEPRYNFESELQPACPYARSRPRCISMNQDTILKANYNISGIFLIPSNDVFQWTKIQFWKRITTANDRRMENIGCISMNQDTILKANYNVQVLVV